MTTEFEHLSATKALEVAPPSSGKRTLAWAMWDWGTQPFNSVIITFVFSVYLTSEAFGNTDDTSSALGIATLVSGLIVALIAPVLGQRSDRTGRTVFWLRILTWAIALISASLYFVKPHPEYLWLGLGLLGIGSIINEIAGVNYNSTIDQVATGKNVGRVSGFGWGMGYLGGIVSLLALNFAFIAPERGLFGASNHEGMDIRISMLACALWTLLFTIPPLVMLKDRPARPGANAGFFESYKLLWRTLVELKQTSPRTLYFLIASALFRDGLTAVFAFGGPIAAGTFGFSAGQVIMFGAVANIVAGIATIASGVLDDRIGPKTVIITSLVSLSLCGIAIFVLHGGGTTVFWVVGLLMCLFVGPAQSASRSFLARLIPEGRSGEIFGLYATTGRAISFLSPALFTAAIWIGRQLNPSSDNNQYWGILGIVVVLVAGLLVMIPVKAPEESAA